MESRIRILFLKSMLKIITLCFLYTGTQYSFAAEQSANKNKEPLVQRNEQIIDPTLERRKIITPK